jgi:hypothetical protein
MSCTLHVFIGIGLETIRSPHSPTVSDAPPALVEYQSLPTNALDFAPEPHDSLFFRAPIRASIWS